MNRRVFHRIAAALAAAPAAVMQQGHNAVERFKYVGQGHNNGQTYEWIMERIPGAAYAHMYTLEKAFGGWQVKLADGWSHWGRTIPELVQALNRGH